MGPDLWNRKSSFEILPYLEKSCSNVYLEIKLILIKVLSVITQLVNGGM